MQSNLCIYANVCMNVIIPSLYYFVLTCNAVVVVVERAVMATARRSSAVTVDVVLAVYVVDQSLLDRPAAVHSSWTPAAVHHNASPDRRRRVHVY